MNIFSKMLTVLIRTGLRTICKIDTHAFKKIPSAGPLILYTNHTGEIEAPIMYTEVFPRKTSGLSKVENYNIALFAWLFTQWEIYPVKRGEADMEAMRKSLSALERGYIFGIAPEGTRSKTGALQKVHAGAVSLALHSGAPLQPIAHWGGMHFGANIKRLKRTRFNVNVGRLFYLDARGEKMSKEIRQKMADEMMYQLARLLPEEFRGAYADVKNATEKYLRFIDK